MILVLVLAVSFAVLDWVALARGWRRLEAFAKPAVMLVLLVFLFSAYAAGGFSPLPLLFFVLGILLSLLGDVLLLLPPRFFTPGLIAFLLAHVAYILGFNLPLPDVSLFVSLGVAFLLALTVSRVLRRVIAGLRAKSRRGLIAPVTAYGVVITLMLLSALLTLFRLEWNMLAAGLAALGGILFAFSDLLLAWDRFVSPMKNGPVIIMVLYHLGQILLASGVFLQF